MVDQARILVVDDDENVAKTLSAILEEKGYSVETAKDGKEAIEKSSKRYYDLALIDIRLPDMEGTELLTSMKETVPKMVKIVVTGYPSLQNAVEAVNKGADAYIIKPVNLENLLDIVKTRLKRQQESKKYTEERVAEFIETRARNLEQSS